MISSCSGMSSRYYLPIWHDVIAKYLYEFIKKKKDPKCKIEYKGNTFVSQDNGTEYWWNVAIKTAAKVRYNQPDLVIWDIETKNCQIIEFSCPVDVNVSKKAAEKLENYGPLLRTLQLAHPNYQFPFIPIIIGALGTVLKDLHKNIRQLDFNRKEPMLLSKQFNKELL